MKQPELAKRLRDEILAAYLADNCKARLLQPDGEYVRAPKTGAPFSAQDYLMGLAQGSGAKIPVVAEKPAVKSEPARTEVSMSIVSPVEVEQS